MSLIQDKHQRVAAICLLVLGIILVEIRNKKAEKFLWCYKIFVRVILVLHSFCKIMILPTIIRKRQYKVLLEAGSVLLMYALTFWKLRVCNLPTTHKLLSSLRSIEESILSQNDPRLQKIFWMHKKYNATISKLIIGLGYFSLILFYITPILKDLDFKATHPANATQKRALFLPTWVPFDPQKNLLNYSIAYGMSMLGGFFICSATAIPNAFLWGFMSFVITQLNILDFKIRHLKQEAKEIAEKDLSLSKSEAFRMALKNCVMLHQFIIGFVADIDDTLHILMVLDFVFSSLQISLCFFRALIYIDQHLFFTLAVPVVFAIFICGQMVLYQWHGNEIILESKNISNAIWDSNWEELDPENRRTLQFIMLRAQKPLILKYGFVTTMSIESALSVLKGAYSYIALINATYSSRSN